MEYATLVVKNYEVIRTYLFVHPNVERVREQVEKMFKYVITSSGYTCELEHLEQQYFEDLSCQFTVAISYPVIIDEEDE